MNTEVINNSHIYTAGDKVFVPALKRLGSVLNVYGNGLAGHQGEIRLDLCGNTHITEIEPYDPVTHAQFDDTFLPIRKQWKIDYEITQDVPVRD